MLFYLSFQDEHFS